jgi:small subunit ribosomal protein S1
MNDNVSESSVKAPAAEESEELEDFAALYEESFSRSEKKIQRDTRVEGTVVSVGEEWVFVDVGAKSEANIAREELLDENGELSVKVGDRVTAYVVRPTDGDILLSVKMTAAASEEVIRGAQRSGVPVEGLVVGERKGGFSVTVLGKSAFCPYSQIDVQHGGVPADFIGKRLTFRITEYSDRGRNIVLSRRDLLEEERRQKVAELRQTLVPGMVVTGVVRNLAAFGAFVDIGGVEGLVPMSELAWYRVQAAEDVLTRGEQVTVKVMDVDWDKRKISLSLKQTLADPWDTLGERFSEDTVVPGTVNKLMNFGAFVELEPGIEGLVHVSNLAAGRRINHPKEVLEQGDQVEVRILSIDRASRRIGLELVPDSSLPAPPELKEGDVVPGIVDAVKEYGVFIMLPGNRTGLLHVSEILEARGTELRKLFPLGSSITVQIIGMDHDSKRISLSTKSLGEDQEKREIREFTAAKGERSSLGTLGDLLKDKIKT